MNRANSKMNQGFLFSKRSDFLSFRRIDQFSKSYEDGSHSGVSNLLYSIIITME